MRSSCVQSILESALKEVWVEEQRQVFSFPYGIFRFTNARRIQSCSAHPMVSCGPMAVRAGTARSVSPMGRCSNKVHTVRLHMPGHARYSRPPAKTSGDQANGAEYLWNCFAEHSRIPAAVGSTSEWDQTIPAVHADAEPEWFDRYDALQQHCRSVLRSAINCAHGLPERKLRRPSERACAIMPRGQLELAESLEIGNHAAGRGCGSAD